MFKRKCKHPFAVLVAEKDSTEFKIDEDFIGVDYHLLCTECNETLTLKYAKLIGGVDAFLARGSRV